MTEEDGRDKREQLKEVVGLLFYVEGPRDKSSCGHKLAHQTLCPIS